MIISNCRQHIQTIIAFSSTFNVSFSLSLSLVNNFQLLWKKSVKKMFTAIKENVCSFLPDCMYFDDMQVAVEVTSISK